MINFPEIQQIICDGEKIQPQALQDKTHKREVVFTRQLIMYFVRHTTKESLSQIGKHFKKDHATVIYSCKQIEDLAYSDWDVKAKINFYKSLINRLKDFEGNLVTDKFSEVKELLKVKIDNEQLISHELIVIYNKLIEK